METPIDLMRYADQFGKMARFINTACAFTGYRPHRFPWHSNEKDSACISLKNAIIEQSSNLADNGFTNYLCGMACGADQYCASAVLQLREQNKTIKLHCILPCSSQSDRWTAREQAQYHSILDQADSIIYVNRSENKSSMMDRNHFLVDYCSVVFAVCRNTSERRSGTAATIRYARNVV